MFRKYYIHTCKFSNQTSMYFMPLLVSSAANNYFHSSADYFVKTTENSENRSLQFPKTKIDVLYLIAFPKSKYIHLMIT